MSHIIIWLIIWCIHDFTSSIIQPALTHTALSVLVLSKCLLRFLTFESPTNDSFGFGAILVCSFGGVLGGEIGVAEILVFELACFESVELRGVCFSFDIWVILLFLSFTKSRDVCFSFIIVSLYCFFPSQSRLVFLLWYLDNFIVFVLHKVVRCLFFYLIPGPLYCFCPSQVFVVFLVLVSCLVLLVCFKFV